MVEGRPFAPGERAEGALVVVQGQADLLQVVRALGAAGRLAGRLHGGQQQGDQDGDDGDHDQQLDQRESWTSRTFETMALLLAVGVVPGVGSRAGVSIISGRVEPDSGRRDCLPAAAPSRMKCRGQDTIDE